MRLSVNNDRNINSSLHSFLYTTQSVTNGSHLLCGQSCVTHSLCGYVQTNQKMHDLYATKHIFQMALPDAFWAV